MTILELIQLFCRQAINNMVAQTQYDSTITNYIHLLYQIQNYTQHVYKNSLPLASYSVL